MKTALLCGITLLAAAPVFAQSSASEAAPGQTDTKTVTLTGCVGGGGSDAKAITLTNALVIPGTPQPGQLDQTPSPLPPTASSSATQPDPTMPPPAATAAPAPPSAQSPVGTSGSKTPATSGATGVAVTGTAPAGSSASSVSGYQLSGTDMQPWIGKRVQVIGTFAPPPAASANAGAPAMREFKVQTVTPATGPCPR
jgi:hypothetical protein